MNDTLEEDEIRGLLVCGPNNVPVEGDIVVRLSGTRLRRGMLFECVWAEAEGNDIAIRVLPKSRHPLEGEVEEYLYLDRFAIYRRAAQLDEPI